MPWRWTRRADPGCCPGEPMEMRVPTSLARIYRPGTCTRERSASRPRSPSVGSSLHVPARNRTFRPDDDPAECRITGRLRMTARGVRRRFLPATGPGGASMSHPAESMDRLPISCSWRSC
jgi:hypothetical protein